MSDAEKVQRVWDQATTEKFARDFLRRSWTGIPQVHSNHSWLITGDRKYYWLRYLRDRYFPDGFAGDTLSLGCGEGHVDRLLHHCGLRFRSFRGVDLSQALVAKAQELSDAAGLSPDTRYEVADLNTYRIEPRSFDFIYFFQSLHHVEAIESLLGECASALRPGGLLMVNDFVGPSRFQWRPEQVRRANELLAILPEVLRVDLTQPDGRLKTACIQPTVDEMIAGDPSEAARSEEIDGILRSYFDVVEEKSWGGTLNYLVFENIAGNFDPANPYHVAIAELLIHHENELIAAGVLPSDFKFYVARPKRA